MLQPSHVSEIRFHLSKHLLCLSCHSTGFPEPLVQYNAQLAYNAARNMYRVVASSFGDKGAAVQSRNQLRSQYPDAWLLAK